MSEIALQLVLGIGLLLFSARALVKLAEKLPSSFKISPLFIGITVVALGTSLPELAVSAVALMRNDIGLAMGNIIGSNIVNVLLVFPIGILIGKLRIGTTKTQRNALILIAVTALFIFLNTIISPNFPSGLVLIISGIILTIAEYNWAIFGRKHEDSSKMKHLKKEKFTLSEVITLVFSAVGIVAGGYITVTSTQMLSTITGYSTTVLGLTVTAFATSLPELFTTVFAQEEHQEKLTIGNILGSNIYNLLFIGGIIDLYRTKTFIPYTDWVILALSAILFLIVIRKYSGERVSKWVGIILILCFLAYIYWLSRIRG
ncbi:hypothetical protein A3A76_01450 [Candidatus Woesebacteria bacterium RIFCSPLOWO2_01_FULL_39_23]|uniref:Sodium/calcium exchanger membrane region domain-containing protein n=1 Tax=Candidatus Woesebacteria bacterium RIFCSPHIGHO2_01_FULL_40_22 TaxID=1802499 RepID=A0A1F7YH46_9BACT|nr:MAG: hypothetical protein A2141_04920 [Candidatus Woesebacteria bacterium RBG_16_40_11]OGM26490.1 MAG: hypothetical protein A2628_03045 [Candidatus Woesebacteria bacterium RIFCSPHIGHO2_01_FULL_40_22]OGM37659.1 MAG: hypothetical protein A3E41_05565 [Candidatus Woesebacteria bacterium RIFCSPHIGHO2_12_FULL_38_9]OGM62943.1 MAG: hypothetical protein A3A76_01450 [Candidatus Woesebacteria bacterium RIFCSPLOWO2_01_FULL_39_23]